MRPGQGGSDIEEFVDAGDSVRVCYDNRFKHEGQPRALFRAGRQPALAKAKVMLSSNDTRWMRSHGQG